MNRPITALACLVLCAGGVARSAEWSAAPTLSWTMDHDSSRLLIEEEDASQSGNLQLDLLLKRATGTSVLTLQPHVGWQRYTNDVKQDANNQSLRAGGTWLRPRSTLGAQAAWSRDDSLNNEIAETGTYTGSTRRQNTSAAVSWMLRQSSVSQFQVQASLSDVEYEYERFFELLDVQIPVRSLQGYRYPSVSVNQTHQWSGRTALQFSGYAARLLPDGAGADSASYGVELGGQHDLSERTALLATAGASMQSVEDRDEYGYIGRLELTHDAPLGRWRVFLRRNVAASGYGYLVTQDEAGLSLDRRITPRWAALVSARGLLSKDIGAGERRESRRYERAEAALTWRATPTWQLRGAVAFSRGRRTDDLPLSHGWATLLQASWSPRPQVLSR